MLYGSWHLDYDLQGDTSSILNGQQSFKEVWAQQSRGKTQVFLTRWQKLPPQCFAALQNTPCHKQNGVYFRVFIGVNLGNMILVLLNLTLLLFFYSIEMNIQGSACNRKSFKKSMKYSLKNKLMQMHLQYVSSKVSGASITPP